MTNQFAARQLTGVHLPPLGQQLACSVLIAIIQRITNIGKVMAELAKAKRDVQNTNAPNKCEQRVDSQKSEVN